MTYLLNDPDAAERLEQHQAQPAVADPVSLALGGTAFVAKHRITLQLRTPLGQTPRLWLSRYYWGLAPPVAVDFVKQIQYGEVEVEAKRAYCRERGIRYLLCANEYDEEAVLGHRPAAAAPASTAEVLPDEPLQRPVTAPRSPSKRR